MSKGQEIEDRLIAFAVRIVKLSNTLPSSRQEIILVDNYCAAAQRQPRIMPKRGTLKVTVISSTRCVWV